MLLSDLLFLAFTGIIVGWATGLIVRGHGFGLLGNLVIGLLGAVLGGALFRLLGVYTTGWLGHVAMGVVGAIALLALAGLVRRRGAAGRGLI
jgi:uncharacterized membrane protein YeaQ/YmgE (transglycosylase-associated protein family)